LVRAGELSLSHFRKVTPQRKSDGSPVTIADRECEDLLVTGLTSAFPDTGIRAEEGTEISGSAGTWYVDPIDGTGPFIEGLAHWGPTVCLVRDGAIQVGAFFVPRLGELWYAERGHGAWLTTRGGATQLRPKLVDAIRPGHVLLAPSVVHRGLPVDWPGKVRALGCTAAHLALVASGGAQATLVPRWAPWDIGCGVLLVREAGGVVHDLAGEPVTLSTKVSVPFLAGSSPVVSSIIHPDRSRQRSERSTAPRN